MTKGIIFILLGLICVIGAYAMYQIGNNSSHVSELKAYFYVPLPLAAAFLALGIKEFTTKK